MPKLDINRALNSTASQAAGRKKLSSLSTRGIIDNSDLFVNEKNKLNLQLVPIDQLRERDVNEFSDTDITSLADSIRVCGLISPLSVIFDKAANTYTISAGHRRFKALQHLHELYPDNDEYTMINCNVYEVTEDPQLLEKGLPYISKEVEERIYMDSNLENRQLSYTDVAHQICYILERFEDPAYFEQVKKRAYEQGIYTYNSRTDRTKLIIISLSGQNYDGWKPETIRQFIKIYDSGRKDLIEEVVSGNSKVGAVYKKLVEESNQTRRRKTSKLTGLKKPLKALMEEAETRTYTPKEIDEIKEIIASLEKVIEDNGVEKKQQQ